VAGCVWLVAVRAPGAGKQAVLPGGGPADREARWMGVATCASMSCHHANGPAGTKGSEYSTWAGYDNHARAFQVLYDERSERMVRNLYRDKAVPATETALCLKCHAMNDGGRRDDGTPKGKPKGNLGPRFVLADGVGCESCHGAAEKWLTVHYQPGFKDLPAAKKAELGLRNTRQDKDLSLRAKLCTECHVGDANKDVNHDLIAAGHPRLNFEFGAFHGMYPKHWDPVDDRRRHPDFEARAWAVGQVVSARAALELLEARARGANKTGPDNKPWPEFAEYACFACHKDLKVDSPRQLAGYPGRKPGSFPWGTWYLSMAKVYADETGEGRELGAALQDLRRLMQSPGPSPTEVAARANAGAEALKGWLGRVQAGRALTAADVRGLMRAFARSGAGRADSLDWDETAQLYLALGALYQGLGDFKGGLPPAQVRRDLLTIRDRLKTAFPKGFDSPRRFDPLADPKLSGRFLDIREQLGQ
jgi:hypothetical protein